MVTIKALYRGCPRYICRLFRVCGGCSGFVDSMANVHSDLLDTFGSVMVLYFSADLMCIPCTVLSRFTVH